MLNDFEAVFDRIDAMFRAKKMTKFKTLMRGAITNISNLVSLLVRKSILKENLYNYSEEEREDFFLPDEKQFLENEKARVIYDRLKALMSAFEFQASTLPGDTRGITLKYLENTKKLLNYFAFYNLNAPNAGINTRVLKDMIDKIMASKDQILRKVVHDNIKLLADNYNKISKILEEFINLKREDYRVQVRFKIFPYLSEKDFSEQLLNENPTLYLKKVINFMNAGTLKIPIIKNWLLDALKSCYTVKAESELERLKNTFLTEEHKNDTRAILHSPREKLIGIIEKFSQASPTLEKIYNKIDLNLRLTQNRKKTFLEQIVDMFKKAINTNGDEDFYQLEYINPATKSIENDTININDFLLTIKKKIILYKSIGDSNSATSEKIKRGTEDALYKFIEDTYFDLLLTKERVIGLDSEIRLRVTKKSREQLKDLNINIEQLDSQLQELAQSRRKYVIEQDSYISKSKNGI